MKVFIRHLVLVFLLTGVVFAQKVSVDVGIEKHEVYQGESFLFQITVDGDDSPQAPDMSTIKDFSVENLGGQTNNSTSVTIINGQITKNVIRRYVMSYRFTPKRLGSFIIPQLAVGTTDGVIFTRPLRLHVKKPVETKDFKLRMSLSSAESYVGEPLTLSIVWYIGKNVEDFRFNLPFISDKQFLIAVFPQTIDPSEQDRYVRVELPIGEVFAKKEKRSLGGRQYLSLSFKLVLIPKETGEFLLPQSTVSCTAVIGYRKPNRYDPFGGFFSEDFFFGNRQRGILKHFVTPSNSLQLNVHSVPSDGKPAGFNGLVGQYSISTSASPTKVRVGDPITLTMKISGTDFLQHIPPPDWKTQPGLYENFKIPADIADGIVQGNSKVFTQTLRVRHATVKEIPAIKLPYFDTVSGRYKIAQSNPIPLEVESARVITVADIEGKHMSQQSSGAVLETLSGGIRHNYEDQSVLKTQQLSSAMWFKSPMVLTLLVGLPLMYIVLFALRSYIHSRGKNSERVIAKKAFLKFEKSLPELRSTTTPRLLLYDFICEYLGAKFHLAPGAITFSDVEMMLRSKDVSEETVRDLKHIFEECEAAKFAGSVDSGASVEDLIAQSWSMIRELEKVLK